MKKTLTLLFIVITLFLSANKVFSQVIDCRLVNIKYYNGCGCSKKSPIKVRICFNVNQTNLEKLKIEIKHPNSVVYTGNIEEYDANGNVYYSFCARKDEINEFDVRFRADGIESLPVHISAQANDLNIETVVF